MTARRLMRGLGTLFDSGAFGDLRLRTRFVTLLTITVVAFGGVNLLLLDAVVGHVLAEEVENRALSMARRLAAETATPILHEDVRTLRTLSAATMSADQGVGYVVVVSRERRVLASTFGSTIPAGLLAANRVRGRTEGSVLVSDRGVDYRDVAVPILLGELGEIRLGTRLDHIRSGQTMIRLSVVAMVLAFLVAGLAGATSMAEVISSPVERLARAARTFDPAQPAAPFDFAEQTRGEIGELVRSFQSMASRLQQLHADRQAFQDRIVRAERLATLGALAAGIAHEVNNPLAGIRNCLQAVAREPEDTEQTRTYAQMMIDATHSIEQTVRSLRDVAARSRPVPALVDLRSLTERVSLLLRHRAGAAGVRLEVDLAEPVPALRTDEGLLQQVLVNLVINAVDASPSGSVVSLHVATREESRVTLSVIDRGAGIAPEIRDRVFDPFVTTKADRGGTGLGLAMVRRLVSELGGTVSFESTGGGTRFDVVLPAGRVVGRSEAGAPEAS